MKNYISTKIILLIVLLLSSKPAGAGSYEYFFGNSNEFNSRIPSPGEFLGYETGTHHARYDQLVAYFRELDRISENARLEVIGHTTGGRPLLVLVVSSEENLSNLEEIRLNHLRITDPNSTFDHNTLPTINMLGFGVHGNESSAPEAAMLTAWYLLASLDEQVESYLNNGIWFIEPSRNPDGHDRHAQWVNSQKSKNLVADPADLEHNEAYPGGRGNHYWFDLNRDWLPAIHVESRARLEFFHNWIPHIATCHHEMGTNSTFFFEPTKPVGNESPIVPRSHYEMNNKFANYFAGALDDLGALYYTKEDFDNFNPTFGSSYPDYNGSLAILFEQGSSRGFVQERAVGEITFEEAIRNQLAVSLASIKASVELKAELIENQKNFFRTAIENGTRSSVKGYIFGDSADQNRNLLMADLLRRHRVEVYENDDVVTVGGKTFYPGRSFIVPTAQAQNRMVELFFNPDISVPDSVFYDGSTWTVVLAFGLPYSTISDNRLINGRKPYINSGNPIPAGDKSSYAYLISWSDYNSPALLSGLFKNDIVPYVALQPFSSSIGGEVVDFGYGTLVIPVAGQKLTSDELYSRLSDLGARHSIRIHPAVTGYNVRGIDLGSRNVRPLVKPSILILTGRGISSLESGEAWYLVDNYLDVPVTRTDIANLGILDLNRYTTIILPSIDTRFGSNIAGEPALARLKRWIAEGGTLIALNRASEWVISNEFVSEKMIKNESDSGHVIRTDYGTRREVAGSAVVGGTILQADIDLSHPIGFGFTDRKLAVLKNNVLALEFSENPYNTVAAFESDPHISGYISRANLELFANTSAVIANQQGRGQTILFAFNPIHRASWHSSARLFYNSIFFSQLLGGGPVRYRAYDYD
jgi:hypothetical protein